jgi:hypothetical protein
MTLSFNRYGMRPRPFRADLVDGASVVCTVATGKFLPQAFIAIESALAHSEIATIGVILIGDDSDVSTVETPNDILVLRLADVMTPAIAREMRLVYTPREFGTSLKPFLVATVLSAVHGGRVLLTDADTLCVSNIDAVFHALDACNILIFPHYITATHDFAGTKRDKNLLPFGVFNTGLMALRDVAESHALVSWWSLRTRFWNRDFLNGHEYLDQRWFDFVPSLFAGVSCRGVLGMNVGYWNLFELSMRAGDATLSHMGAPVALLHISGISLAPQTPIVIVALDAEPQMAAWWTAEAERYRDLVLARRAHFPAHADVPARFADGALVSSDFRRYAFAHREESGELSADETWLRRASARRRLGLAIRECSEQVGAMWWSLRRVLSAARGYVRARGLR